MMEFLDILFYVSCFVAGCGVLIFFLVIGALLYTSPKRYKED